MTCATYTLNYYNGSVLLEHLLIENFWYHFLEKLESFFLKKNAIFTIFS